MKLWQQLMLYYRSRTTRIQTYALTSQRNCSPSAFKIDSDKISKLSQQSQTSYAKHGVAIVPVFLLPILLNWVNVPAVKEISASHQSFSCFKRLLLYLWLHYSWRLVNFWSSRVWAKCVVMSKIHQCTIHQCTLTICFYFWDCVHPRSECVPRISILSRPI